MRCRDEDAIHEQSLHRTVLHGFAGDQQEREDLMQVVVDVVDRFSTVRVKRPAIR
jgi:hypothetical protein